MIAFQPDGQTAFWRELGGEGIDFFWGIGAGEGGEIWLAGQSEGFEVDGVTVGGEGSTDAVLLEMSPEGDVRWARSFGGEGPELASDLVADPATGELVIAGWTSGSPTIADAPIPADAVLSLFLLRLLP